MSRLFSSDVTTLILCREIGMMSRLSSLDITTWDFGPLSVFFFAVLFVFHDIPTKTLNLVKYPEFAFKTSI